MSPSRKVMFGICCTGTCHKNSGIDFESAALLLTTMTTVVYLQCENCMRRGPDINIGSVSYAAVRRKNQVKYYNIKERRHEAVMICSHCNRYLFEVKKRPGDYWPALVYCFLTCKSGPDILDVPFRDRWKLLPREWRIWWEYEFIDIIGEETECLFRDVTKQLARAEVVLEELKWKDLSKFMDEHLAYPEVRNCDYPNVQHRRSEVS